MVFITGDTHGRFERFDEGFAPHGKLLTCEDCVIICGDFGGVWYQDDAHERKLNHLATLPYTILFTDGNHENYDLLATYPQREWHGGKVQAIRANVLHLMRGQIYELEGKSCFVMGGAASHDVWNGILDPDAPDFEETYYALRKRRAFVRIKGVSWWPQELPSAAEYQEAWDNLRAHGNRVDVVISHCAPTSVQREICWELNNDTYSENELTDFLQRVYGECSFDAWYCGHYHRELEIDKLRVLYESVCCL